MSSNIDGLDRLQRVDHDTLIRVESKLDTLVTDMKEVKDGTAKQIADLNSRLTIVEGVINDTKPTDLKKLVDAMFQQNRDFKFKWKFVVGMAGVLGGFIGFLLATLRDFMHLFGAK